MSRKYKFHDNNQLYFITYAVVYWIDVFIRNEYKEILLESWRFCIHHKGLEVYAWCIMTSHVHMIVGSSDKPLDKIIREMKSFTATQLRESIKNHPQESRKEWMLWMMEKAGKQNNNNKNDFQFWQQHNHPIELFNNFMLDQKLVYIHNNPVTAGIVDTPEAYLYSSASDYCGEKGLLSELKLIE